MKIKFLFSALFLFLHLCWCQDEISTNESTSTTSFGLAITTTGEIVKSTGLTDNNSNASKDASGSGNLSKSNNFPSLNNILTISDSFAANSETSTKPVQDVFQLTTNGILTVEQRQKIEDDASTNLTDYRSAATATLFPLSSQPQITNDFMQKTSYIQQPSEIIPSSVAQLQSFSPNAVKSAGTSFMQNNEKVWRTIEQGMLSTESNVGLTNTVQINANQATILNPTNCSSVTVSEPAETSFGQDNEKNESTVEQNMSPTETNDDFVNTAQNDANHPPTSLQAKMSLLIAQTKPIQLLATTSTVHYDRINGRPQDQSEMDKTYQQIEKISNEIRTEFSYMKSKWKQFRIWVILIVGGLVGIVVASVCLWCSYKKRPSMTPVFPFSSRN